MSEAKHVLRVTVEDLETGGREVAMVPPGEYLILCTTTCHIAYTQVTNSGRTVQLTIKGRIPR